MITQQSPRQSMIQSQLLTGSVLDERVISAMSTIAKEEFLPDKFKGAAYLDEDIEFSAGRFLMEPLTFARLLVLADIKDTDTVLDVACVTGYSSAVISKLAAKVVAIEEIRDIAQKAKTTLSNLGINNVEVVTAPLTLGNAASAPYDVIIIEGAVQMIPDGLKQQLASGGRLVTIENIATKADSNSGLGKMVVYTNLGNTLSKRVAFDANVALLAPFQATQEFTL